MRTGSLESLVCALEHENGVGDLEGRSELDAHDLHNVGLGQQQEGLAVDHLMTQAMHVKKLTKCRTRKFSDRNDKSNPQIISNIVIIALAVL